MTASPEDRLPEAVLRPVRGHHAFEACVEQLATAIRLGVYPRGTTLPAERDLAVMLGVSRPTLREAIAAGPPLFQPRPNDVKQPARIEMIENEMAKFEKPDQERFSSCV